MGNDMLRVLSQHADESVRFLVAVNTNTPADALYALSSRDDSARVREAALSTIRKVAA